MAKFKVSQEADYVMGHLRYGHREGIIEAESKEDALQKLKDGYASDYLMKSMMLSMAIMSLRLRK